MKKPNILIIGSGIAALQLARQIQDQFYVRIITKNKITSSNSYLAQGGIAAPIGKNDRIEDHYLDTLAAGRYHQAEDLVNRLINDGKRVIEALVKEGAPFDKDGDGNLSLGMEGAHSANRILHSGGDQTGKFLVNYLLGTLTNEVDFIEEEMVCELMKDNKGTCCGVKTKNEEGTIRTYYASHVVLATEGIGGLYSSTSNHPSVSGDGMALAFLAGAKLADMEFIQFHPTLLWMNGKTHGLISEAVRGEGATLINDRGERIMENVDPLLELAPRHIVAERIYQQRLAGREVFLDISKIKNFQVKFPSISTLFSEQKISIEKGKIPVSPGCHFMMGGILTDDVGRTNVPGLYAIGEVACSGVHGANRLASNSLLEGLVYGVRLGNYLIEQGENCSNHHLMHVEQKNRKPITHMGFQPHELKERMMKSVGIIRFEDELNTHLNWLKSHPFTLNENIDSASPEQIKIYFMWIVSMLITQSALLRTESRGGHIRSDFPEENNEIWLKRKIILQKQENQLRVKFHEQNETKVYA
ncbi:L-aspartate oxidase [Rossellomorea aquimaris]|uniref:L-aspartate oxidase n=1 Tax=Rossellomorea aquimaris TaxID=189382 RepID=UPI0007D05AD9|nr:L-aspartate oxidase [Rossellomorea aquimaris]